MVQAKLTVAQRGHSCSHTWFACAWHSKVDSSLEHCVYADQSAGAGAAEGLEGKPKMSLAGDADNWLDVVAGKADVGSHSQGSSTITPLGP